MVLSGVNAGTIKKCVIGLNDKDWQLLKTQTQIYLDEFYCQKMNLKNTTAVLSCFNCPDAVLSCSNCDNNVYGDRKYKEISKTMFGLSKKMIVILCSSMVNALEKTGDIFLRANILGTATKTIDLAIILKTTNEKLMEYIDKKTGG